MNRMKLSIAAAITAAGLATGALVVTSLASAAADTEVAMPSTPAEHTAEAAKYEQEATDLDAKAAKHSRMAAQYKARGTGGSKQAAAAQSIANHCNLIAKAYSSAAAEARELAKMHREMAAAG